nr:DNA primase [Periweissella beninensis]
MRKLVSFVAKRIPDEVISDVRNSVNITDIVSEYVQLHKQGRNYFGKCPWHEERTASFSVNEEKQIFHCFSCGRGGNVFQFLIDILNISFPEAVIKIAEQQNIPIDEQYLKNEQAPKPKGKEAAIYDLYQQAAKLYHHMLVNTQAGDAALNYLTGRGLGRDLIDTFNLGYAPTNELLLPYFQEKGIEYTVLRDSALFIEDDEGQLHDRFTNRVLFPIRNMAGQVVAFSGRRMANDDSPKYINSPESAIFKKSRELFNLDLAKQMIRKSKTVFLFEGYMDVLAAYTTGLPNGVASMGTSLTPEQVGILTRFAETLIIAYDDDEAGQKATARAIKLVQAHSNKLAIKVVRLAEKLDPDEYLKKYGATALQNALQHSLETPLTFMRKYLRNNYNLANEAEKLAYIEAILKVIAQSPNQIERQIQVNELATEFAIKATTLEQQLSHFEQEPQNDQRGHANPLSVTKNKQLIQAPPLKSYSRIERAQRTLLLWMIHDPLVWQNVTALDDFHFSQVEYETLFLMAQGYKTMYQTFDLGAFLDFIQDPNLISKMSELENDPLISAPQLSIVPELIQIITKEIPLATQIATTVADINEAKQLGNNELLLQLTNQYISLLREQQASRQ